MAKTSLSSFKPAAGMILIFLGAGLCIGALVTTGWLVDWSFRPRTGETSRHKGYGLFQVCDVAFLTTFGVNLDCETVASKLDPWLLTIEILFTVGCACAVVSFITLVAGSVRRKRKLGKAGTFDLGFSLCCIAFAVLLMFFSMVLYFAKFKIIYNDDNLSTDFFSYSFALGMIGCLFLLIGGIFVKLSIEDIKKQNFDEVALVS